VRLFSSSDKQKNKKLHLSLLLSLRSPFVPKSPYINMINNNYYFNNNHNNRRWYLYTSRLARVIVAELAVFVSFVRAGHRLRVSPPRVSEARVACLPTCVHQCKLEGGGVGGWGGGRERGRAFWNGIMLHFQLHASLMRAVL
jgi:hypothetical protein